MGFCRWEKSQLAASLGPVLQGTVGTYRVVSEEGARSAEAELQGLLRTGSNTHDPAMLQT